MNKDDDFQEISPEEIKEIRKSLGLSQIEAGELLGGGPRAFSKYENGSVKPSVALTRILKFLKLRPEELRTVSGGEDGPVRKRGENPFEVKGKDVSQLNPSEFSQLVRKLLSAEAQEYGLPRDGIHVSSEISAPDGGEDARIEWRGEPERTPFLPNSLCVFQLKTGAVSPAKAESEILDSGNQVKPRIRATLEKGGSYVILCSKAYARKQIEERENRIREKLRQHDILTEENRVQFRDLDQIASWVNSHPSIALWLLRKTHPGLASPFFGDWGHWFRRKEHFGSRWVDDPRLPGFRERLRNIVGVRKGVARVVGPAGTGKSRLVLEALGPTETERVSGVKLSDLVLYAVESEIGSHMIKEYAWSLANSGKRAVLVVNGCSEETRTGLANIVNHSDSSLSLVTIETETRYDMPESENTLFVKAAERELIEEIIKSEAPRISARDRERITDFSGGIISCARITAKSWHRGGFIFSDEEQALVRKYVGHEGGDLDPVYEAAKLISVFGGVGTEAPGNEAEQVARLGSRAVRQDFQTCINRLRIRGVVVSLAGGFAVLMPGRVAVILAELQWKEWSQSRWEEVLVGGDLSDELRIRAADRLALLNTGTVAREIVRHILGEKTLWLSPENLRRNLKLLYSFAQIDPQRVADLLEEILKTLPPEELQDETTSYDLIEILRQIVFPEETFEIGATLLLELARLGNEDARGLFVSLFPVRLAATEAGREKRLSLIDEHINADDDTILSVIVDALEEGTKTALFSRTIAGEGPETHGSRPVIESWSPESGEAWEYIRLCTEKLVKKLAKRCDGIGAEARDVLGRNIYGYIINGMSIEDVERWLLEVKEKHPYWPEALVALGNVLKYSAGELPGPIEARVEKLMSDMEPRDLDRRVQFFLRDMPYGHFYRKTMDEETHLGIKRKKAEQLAEDLLAREGELEKLVPELCAEEQGMMTRLLGLGLAKKTRKPLYWKEAVMRAFESANPPRERDCELLLGYMEGLGERNRKEFIRFKQQAKTSPVFAPVLPSLMFHTGISPEDIEIIAEALEAGLITHEEMSAWDYSGRLSELEPEDVTPLFDLMLRSGEMLLFESGLKLIYSYVHKNSQILDSIRLLLSLTLRNGELPFFEVGQKLLHIYAHENNRLLDSMRPLLLIASGYLSVIKNEARSEPLHSPDKTAPIMDSVEEHDGKLSIKAKDWPDLCEGWEDFFRNSSGNQLKTPAAGLQYETLMNWILSQGSENSDARAVAVKIAKQIIEEEDLPSYPAQDYLNQEIIKPVLPHLLSSFGEIVWPLIGPAVKKNKAKFLSIMGERLYSPHEEPPVLHLSENTLFGWCHANPEVGPAFVAEAVPLLVSSPPNEEGASSEEFHPLIKRLIDEFGDHQDVLDALESHMNASRGAVPIASAQDRYAVYRRPLESIENHEKGAVRRWAGKMLRKIADEIETLKV